MKSVRVIMFLSPFLLLLPPLVPSDSLAWGMLGMFYGGLLRFFPWNILLAVIAYTYARNQGREGYWWAVAVTVFPYAASFILACLPPKPGSTAAEMRAAAENSRGTPAEAASGAFEERFPLLGRTLAACPEEIRAEQRKRFEPVRANFEFLLVPRPDAVSRLLTEAEIRKFVVWASKSLSGSQLYGAGLVRPDRFQETTAWLAAAGAPGSKFTAATRDRDGRLSFSEEYFEQQVSG
jgi:hypothetical protein